MTTEHTADTAEIFQAIKARIKTLSRSLESDVSRDRGQKNRELWSLQKALGHMPEYFSDAGQDMILDRYVFQGKRKGTFVELGGNDGLHGSNCLFFEMMRQWDGLLIEGNPAHLELASAFRRCTCVDAVVSGGVREATFLQIPPGAAYSQMGGMVDMLPQITRDAMAAEKISGQEVTATTQTLPDILRAHGITHIDFLAIDIEGAEMDVLRAFPFDEFSVSAVCIENQNKNDTSFTELLQDKGFVLLEYLGLDEMYVDAAISLDAAT